MQGAGLIRHSRLTALGVILCLLAALFSVEAKLAWYGPAGSAGTQISFAKARPAEQPRMLPERFAWPSPPASDFSGTAALIAFVLVFFAHPLSEFQKRPKNSGLPESSGFSSALFFRPPPVL
jgi:hypothetical protein